MPSRAERSIESSLPQPLADRYRIEPKVYTQSGIYLGRDIAYGRGERKNFAKIVVSIMLYENFASQAASKTQDPMIPLTLFLLGTLGLMTEVSPIYPDRQKTLPEAPSHRWVSFIQEFMTK